MDGEFRSLVDVEILAQAGLDGGAAAEGAAVVGGVFGVLREKGGKRCHIALGVSFLLGFRLGEHGFHARRHFGLRGRVLGIGGNGREHGKWQAGEDGFHGI